MPDWRGFHSDQGNPHTKPGQVGFELGTAEWSQAQGFAHMWKIRPWERGFGGFAAAVQFDAAGCVLGEIPSASLRAGSRPTETRDFGMTPAGRNHW